MGSREKEEFEQAAKALRQGEIGEDEFVRRMRRKWRGTAALIFSRYRRKLPEWVEVEDVEQELVLEALAHVRSWDPDRANGAAIGHYVTWGSIHRVQRVLDHWRGASLTGNHGKNKGRAEIAFCRAFAPDEDPLAQLAAAEPEQEGEVDQARAYDALLAGCECLGEALVILALRKAGGCAAEAAEILFSDYRSRVELELGDERDARREVARRLRSIVGRKKGEETPEWPEDLFEGEEEGVAEPSAEAAA